MNNRQSADKRNTPCEKQGESKMEITCPNCGQTCEVDEEPAIGQHLLCPFCDMKFNYTPQNTTENDSNSIANMAETNVEEPPAKIQAICPHCGAVYEVDASYIGKTATCGVCDNPFVIKAAHGHAVAASSKESSPEMLFAKAKAAVNTAKDTLIPVLKTAANKTKTKAIPALKSAANAAKIKTVALWQRLVDLIIRIAKNANGKFQHKMAARTRKMAAAGYLGNIPYPRRNNKFATVFIALIAIAGLLNIGILSVGIYLGWRYIKGQESAHEASLAQQQAEHDAMQMRREQEEREQRQIAQMRREQEERQAAQILAQLLINGNSNRQSTSSDSQRWNDCLRSVIRVGGGEGARQVQVYEDEMIRQRARQGMPLW